MLLSYEYQTWVSLTNYSQGLGKLWILLSGWPTLTINMLSRYVITVRIQDLAFLLFNTFQYLSLLIHLLIVPVLLYFYLLATTYLVNINFESDAMNASE